MSIAEVRRGQMFPCLSDARIATAERFATGSLRDIAVNEILFSGSVKNLGQPASSPAAPSTASHLLPLWSGISQADQFKTTKEAAPGF